MGGPVTLAPAVSSHGAVGARHASRPSPFPAAPAEPPARGASISPPTSPRRSPSPRARRLRLQQMLAELGYLPLNFTAASPLTSPTQEGAAQVGTFTWRWANQPASLTSLWTPGHLQRDHQGRRDELRGAAQPQDRRHRRTCGVGRRADRVGKRPRQRALLRLRVRDQVAARDHDRLSERRLPSTTRCPTRAWLPPRPRMARSPSMPATR